MQQFQITLKNEKIRLYNQLSWIIIAIHIVIFLYFSLFSGNNIIRWTCLGAILLLTAFFILRFYIRKPGWQTGFHPFFIILILGWINMYQFWIAAIPLIFDILNTISTRKLIAFFSEDKIAYPSFPPKTINWNNLNNVILKDGLLTIDFKNNKLIQQAVDNGNSVVDEKEFNDFCLRQLNK
jgi:hypothetical protein